MFRSTGWGSLGSIVGGGIQGARYRVIILRECIWNAPAVSLVLPAFDDTGSLGFPPRRMGLSPVFNVDDCLLFPCGE